MHVRMFHISRVDALNVIAILVSSETSFFCICGDHRTGVLHSPRGPYLFWAARRAVTVAAASLEEKHGKRRAQVLHCVVIPGLGLYQLVVGELIFH